MIQTTSPSPKARAWGAMSGQPIKQFEYIFPGGLRRKSEITLRGLSKFGREA